METIFAAINSSSNLKTLLLCIKGNNLSSVDPDVLARAVNKLEAAIIDDCKLSDEQVARILTQSLLTTNLNRLSMSGNGRVEEDLRRMATQVFKTFYL